MSTYTEYDTTTGKRELRENLRAIEGVTDTLETPDTEILVRFDVRVYNIARILGAFRDADYTVIEYDERVNGELYMIGMYDPDGELEDWRSKVGGGD